SQHARSSVLSRGKIPGGRRYARAVRQGLEQGAEGVCRGSPGVPGHGAAPARPEGASPGDARPAAGGHATIGQESLGPRLPARGRGGAEDQPGERKGLVAPDASKYGHAVWCVVCLWDKPRDGDVGTRPDLKAASGDKEADGS